MADVKWIKITTDIFSDEKILLIEQMPDADSLLVIWFKLLCMAGKENNYGVFMMRNRMPYTEEMLATIFRRPINTVRLALSTFEAFGMIDIEDDIIVIPNWEKHQNIEGMEKIREQNRIRKRRQREKQKQALLEGQSVTVTGHHATDKIRIDKNRIEEENNNMGDSDESQPVPKRKNFIPPSVEEVKAYCIERQNNVDAEAFVDFYESKGWMVGKNKMKDWKAAVRTWEKGNKAKQPIRQETVPSWIKKRDFQQHDYDFDELEKDLLGDSDPDFEERKEALQARLKEKYGKGKKE